MHQLGVQKKLNIGGTNLTQANYGNISGEIRLIGSLKFYQRSLDELSPTFTAEEKNAVKKFVFQFLEQFVRGEKNAPRAYRSTAQAHTNLFKKTFFASVFRRFSVLH